MRTIAKRKISNINYEYVFAKDLDQKVENIYKLIFEELENNPGVYSFKFQNDESKK